MSYNYSNLHLNIMTMEKIEVTIEGKTYWYSYEEYLKMQKFQKELQMSFIKGLFK